MKIENASELNLYGYIGIDVLVQDFIRQLRALEGAGGNITLNINSVGGQMFDGLPMYNNLKASKSNIVADVQGLSASMATIVMLGAKKVRAASNAMIMVHGPRGGDYTTVEGLESLADLMKKMRADMARVYSAKTGKSEQWIIDNWLADGADHWFTAAEAQAAGLVDEVYDAMGERPVMSWSLSKIAAFYDHQHQQPKPTSMKKVIAVLTASQLLSVPESASEELVAEGVQALVNQLSAKQAAIADKDAEIARLKAEALTAKTAALKDRATTIVESAIAAKKITAVQKDKFVTFASASDEGFTAVKEMLDSMQGYTPVAGRITPTSDEFPTKKAELVALHDEIANGKKSWSEYTEEQISALWQAKYGKKISAETLTALKGN